MIGILIIIYVDEDNNDVIDDDRDDDGICRLGYMLYSETFFDLFGLGCQ